MLCIIHYRDKLGHLDPLVALDLLDPLGSVVNLAARGPLDLLDSLDLMANLASLEAVELLESLVDRDRLVPPDHQDLLDHVDHLDLVVSLEQVEYQAVVDNQVSHMQ